MKNFIWVLVAFVTLVGVMVAAMTAQGKAGRDYAHSALQAAPRTAAGPLPCQDVLRRPLPKGVRACRVFPAAQPPRAEIQYEDGRLSAVQLSAAP
ncbi:hypothetical protein ACFP81_02050 [Deinococcus lacus]|uniref:DUF4124 domain-containing protein n=1 Tax=Deinococcus lacus TaxID=392561 RepID=A0ABW1YAA1_9DEIO